MKNTIIIWTLQILGMFLFSPICFSQLKEYSFEQLEDLQIQESKKVVVFIYTDWCKYCKIMKNSTFKNESIINILNQNFYFIKLNGEEKRVINFAEQEFKYKPNSLNNGVHELAEILGEIDGKLIYPALVILNPDYEIIYQNASLLNARDLGEILQFILKSKE